MRWGAPAWPSMASRSRDVLARHLESPGTKAYTEAEIRALFEDFSSIDVRRVVTPYDRRVAWRARRYHRAPARVVLRDHARVRSAAHRLDEARDARLVAPRRRELARARCRSAPAAASSSARRAIARGLRFDVARANELPFSARNEQVGGSTDGVRQHERQAACRSFVHDDAPGLSPREQDEDVGRGVVFEEGARRSASR